MHHKALRVLVGCEESQIMTQAFRARGHDAWSCDIEPTRGDPAYHYQEDIVGLLQDTWWDLIILHPDCTAMAVSGNRWYGKGTVYHHKRIEAVTWTLKLWELAKTRAERVALENPVSVIFKHIKEPVQYVQPYNFGHGETKKTGFALHNLPPLVPTNEVDGREQRIWKMTPSETRKRDRSETYPGIAEACAEQWAA
jgi:hypothetical protein